MTPGWALEVSGLSFLLHTVGLPCCLQADVRAVLAEAAERAQQRRAWPLALDGEKLADAGVPHTALAVRSLSRLCSTVAALAQSYPTHLSPTVPIRFSSTLVPTLLSSCGQRFGEWNAHPGIVPRTCKASICAPPATVLYTRSARRSPGECRSRDWALGSRATGRHREPLMCALGGPSNGQAAGKGRLGLL